MRKSHFKISRSMISFSSKANYVHNKGENGFYYNKEQNVLR